MNDFNCVLLHLDMAFHTLIRILNMSMNENRNRSFEEKELLQSSFVRSLECFDLEKINPEQSKDSTRYSH